MPLTHHSLASLKSLLEGCGYTGSRLQKDFSLGDLRIPYVGFATSERDMDSACIAVIGGDGDPEAAARSCYELAAPIVWVPHNGSIDWWIQRPGKPERFASTTASDFPSLVHKYQSQLDPVTIYRGRTIARVDASRQLDFVDAGLLPLRREEAGRKLHDIVEAMIDATLKAMHRQNPSALAVRDVFASVFRLLAGKILKDKGVGEFADLNLSVPKDVLRAVARHYDTTNRKATAPASGFDVLTGAARLLADAGNFAVVSPESLAYVYEHTLVTKELRKKLGIHATPPWLVDYMVWQLYDWVHDIPIDDRHVFEPACGHAPFLLSMMRLLRMEMHGNPERAVHTYLKNHVHGVEIDDFAREIARLSLTLADIPNPNGWDLQPGNMFDTSVLSEEAKRCRILLSNPPYERFEIELAKGGEEFRPTAKTQPVELLRRTIPNLPVGAVFSVVVPQGVLHSTEAESVRKTLLRDFEIREICLFADKVFEEGEPESVVIIGRRRPQTEQIQKSIHYRRVREHGIAHFAETYEPDSESDVPIGPLRLTSNLRSADLPEVWTALQGNPRLSSIADVGQGFSFEEGGLIAEARLHGATKTADAVRAFVDGHTDANIWETPNAIWLSPSRTPVSPWRSGNAIRKSQVLVNYVRAMRGPWRIKAFLDADGRAAINTYNTVRTKSGDASALVIWAILNSPVANAYVYCNTMQKHIYDTLIGSLPLPARWQDHVKAITSAAADYRRIVNSKNSAEGAILESLLALDAEVLRAYALPLRYERRLLDVFNVPPGTDGSRRRKGVGCAFPDYYPTTLKSLIPLHKYISKGYRNSTASAVAKRMKPGESASVVALLRESARAFGVEE